MVRATRKRRLPLLRRQTGVEKPIAPENRTPLRVGTVRGFADAVKEVDAAFLFLLCEPDLTGEGM
jgi:hypothetical protein